MTDCTGRMMIRPYLIVRKLGYSVDPWRIGLPTDEPRSYTGLREIPHCSFARKRDAVPVCAALNALQAPWEQDPSTWPEGLAEQARAIVSDTESYRRWVTLIQPTRAATVLKMARQALVLES